MNGKDSANAVRLGAFPVKGHVWAGLLVGFCCCHAVFLIASIVPRKSSGDEHANRALNFYRLLVSGDQRWNMFETIPQHHSLDARIEVDDGRGGRANLGSVLPGFTPYPNPEKARYYNLFYRILLDSEKSPLFLAYLRRTDDLLKAQHGNTLTGRWALVVDVEWTRALAESRRDGILYVPATRSFDLANPGGFAP